MENEIRVDGEIIPGAGQIVDEWLGIDDSWRGTPPRYRHLGPLQTLCREDQPKRRDGSILVKKLYSKLDRLWHGMMAGDPREPGRENWRFSKRKEIDPNNVSPEVTLERAIVRITDNNWGNQCPTFAGLLDPGGRVCNIDLIRRAGTEWDFIELKVRANTPLYAAIEILQYGIVYVFSRVYAVPLKYDAEVLEVLRASAIHLQVLAPLGYYSDECRQWLKCLEDVLSDGLSQFASDVTGFEGKIDFRFEAFPPEFTWVPTASPDQEQLKNLLWALHRRQSPFTA